MPNDLRPPPESAHLRWHWLIVDDGTAEGPMPTEWTGDKWIVPGLPDATPEEATEEGWRYHGPADPAALTITPDDPKQIECVALTIATDRECPAAADMKAPLCMDDGACACRYEAGRVLTALKALSDAS